MKFWDTSALVPLVIDEATTEPMRRLLAADPAVVVWALSGVEVLSALGRLGRTSSRLEDLLPSLRHDVLAQFTRCATVTDVDGVRRRAERLVGVHPLTAKRPSASCWNGAVTPGEPGFCSMVSRR